MTSPAEPDARSDGPTLFDSPATDSTADADARVCAPRTPARASRWAPPRPFHEDRCTAAEVEGVAACLDGTTNSEAACGAYIKAHPGCWACTASLDTDDTRGPIIYFDNYAYVELNFVGCIANALGDTSPSGCAAAFGLADDCSRLACSGCTPGASAMADDEFRACRDKKVVSLYCAPEFAAASAKCAAVQADAAPDSAATLCQNLFNTRDYITLWCTRAPADGGGDTGP